MYVEENQNGTAIVSLNHLSVLLYMIPCFSDDSSYLLKLNNFYKMESSNIIHNT